MQRDALLYSNGVNGVYRYLRNSYLSEISMSGL